MTEAEMQVVLDNQKADFKEKMDSMDTKLNQSQKDFKELEKKHRSSDENSQKLYKVEDELNDLKELYSKQTRELDKSTKDIEKLTQSNEGLNATNTKLVIDDGLSKELIGLDKFNVRDGGLNVTVEALKKLNPTIVDGKAMFGDKTAKDFVGEWANSDDSKFYLQSKENSGGGSGGGGGDGHKKEETQTTKETFDEMFPKK